MLISFLVNPVIKRERERGGERVSVCVCKRETERVTGAEFSGEKKWTETGSLMSYWRKGKWKS